MASPRTHYAVLNVAPDAEPVVIDAAYRALMKKYHPDQGAPAVAGGPSATEINNAFAVLRDPQRRADYDHREWTRSQAIQLAQYQAALPSPARRSNFFGWGGWLVALILAGAIGIIATQSGGAPPLPRLSAAKTASLSAANLSSQPPLTEPSVSPAELAEIRADALLGRQDLSKQAVPPPAALPHAPRPQHMHFAARRHTAPTAPADKDFVERHGGIY